MTSSLLILAAMNVLFPGHAGQTEVRTGSDENRLLNAYLAGTVDDDAFKAKTAELKADTARVTEEIDAQGDVDPACGKPVLAVFDWSQKAADIWRGSNTTARRQIPDSICLNRQVSDVTLVTAKRKPFDFFVERLPLKKSRGDRTPLELFVAGVAGWNGLMRRRLDEGKDKAE